MRSNTAFVMFCAWNIQLGLASFAAGILMDIIWPLRVALVISGLAAMVLWSTVLRYRITMDETLLP